MFSSPVYFQCDLGCNIYVFFSFVFWAVLPVIKKRKFLYFILVCRYSKIGKLCVCKNFQWKFSSIFVYFTNASSINSIYDKKVYMVHSNNISVILFQINLWQYFNKRQIFKKCCWENVIKWVFVWYLIYKIDLDLIDDKKKIKSWKSFI